MQLTLSHSRVAFADRVVSNCISNIRYKLNSVHTRNHIRNKPYLGDDSAPRGYDELKDYSELGNSIHHTTE